MNDAELITFWLRNRPLSTSRVYRGIAADFTTKVAKPLRQVTALDVKGYLSSLSGRSAGGKATTPAVLKSLMTFAELTGHIRASPLRHVKNTKPRPTNPNRLISTDQIASVVNAANSVRDNWSFAFTTASDFERRNWLNCIAATC